MLRGDVTMDPATGLPNLFGLFEASHAGTLGGEGVIVAADIGNLGSINARFGRQAGDACVRAAAGFLKAVARSDLQPAPKAFRVGGDEFLLVLPGGDEEQARRLANRVQSDYRRQMGRHGIEASLHVAVFGYDHQGATAGALLKSTYICLEERHHPHMPATPALPAWVEILFDTMAERVCETLQLWREARTMALTDAISGLPNHRAVGLFLEDMLREYKAHGDPCSLLLVDGDNLRAYNEMGYEHGNQMIRALGDVIGAAVRYGDRAARWLSGDEFVVILPRANRQAAVQVAERIRAAVEATSASWPLPVTISVGVASCPTDGTTPEQLLRYAEIRNAAAKRAGKNQVS